MNTKLLLTLGLLVSAVSLGHAQGVRLGVRVAGGRSNLVRSTSLEPGRARSTFDVGVVANVPVSRRRQLSLQSEVLYSSKGNQANYPPGSSYYTSRHERRLHYVETLLPLQWRLARWESSRWKTTSLLVEAGPALAYLVNAQVWEDTGPYSVLGRHERWEVGGLAGVGVQLGLRLGLGVRYRGGLRNVYRKNAVFQEEGYNSSFQLQGTYYIGRASQGPAPE